MSYLASFRVTIESVEGASLIRIGGDLDKSTAAELTRHLSAARGSTSTILVDLANVSFMDSAGLKALAAESDAALAGGGTLFVVRPSLAVRRVITLMGYADRLAVVPSLAIA